VQRVYVRLDDTLWVGVKWLGQQRPLTNEDQYVTLEVHSDGEACLTLPDGRVLCDYGAEHEHG
jgi:hypothetical protein